jgi:hypothetical protein
MPVIMQGLSIVGTAAMVWVGGGILAHGLTGFGLGLVEHAIEGFAHWAETLLPQLSGFMGGLATIAADLALGLGLGLVLIPIMGKVVAPAWRTVRGLFKRDAAAGH